MKHTVTRVITRHPGECQDVRNLGYQECEFVTSLHFCSLSWAIPHPPLLHKRRHNNSWLFDIFLCGQWIVWSVSRHLAPIPNPKLRNLLFRCLIHAVRMNYFNPLFNLNLFFFFFSFSIFTRKGENWLIPLILCQPYIDGNANLLFSMLGDIYVLSSQVCSENHQQSKQEEPE